EAKEKWRAAFREWIINSQPGSIEWVDDWLIKSADRILDEKISNPESVRKSHELKVLRAYRGKLICWNREYLDYPNNWEFKRFKIKHKDGYKCYVCGEGESASLHVHHIVFRSKSGTNSY